MFNSQIKATQDIKNISDWIHLHTHQKSRRLAAVQFWLFLARKSRPNCGRTWQANHICYYRDHAIITNTFLFHFEHV
jgi:hypothetical protein